MDGSTSNPRIGPGFQAEIPDLINSSGAKSKKEFKKDSHAPPSSTGEALWLASRADPRNVETFLKKARELFEGHKDMYDEERALFLLHKCNYNARVAEDLMRPRTAASNSDSELESDDQCFVCGDGGDLIICESKSCVKVYHLACLNLRKVPAGEWMCPRHFCCTCGVMMQDSVFQCSQCVNAYCLQHAPAEAKVKLTQKDFKCHECLQTCKDHKGRRSFINNLLSVLEAKPELSDLARLQREIDRIGGMQKVLSTGGDSWRSLQRVLNPLVTRYARR